MCSGGDFELGCPIPTRTQRGGHSGRPLAIRTRPFTPADCACPAGAFRRLRKARLRDHRPCRGIPYAEDFPLNHLHWMKLYIGDELSNTSHMTPAEFGSYMLLKMHYWRFGCLPTDDERLARIARVTPDQWCELKPSIGPLFDDDWQDEKLEAQRAEAEDRHRKLSEAGKRGGRPRRDEKPGYKPGFSTEKAGHNAWPKQPEPEPEPEPDPYSDPAPKSEPESSALDKGRSDRKFPVPPSQAAGRSMLRDRGVPAGDIERCLSMLMAGHLTPFDIEE
jgi:uncharacterized protein YdaU (DUF1376 family)